MTQHSNTASPSLTVEKILTTWHNSMHPQWWPIIEDLLPPIAHKLLPEYQTGSVAPALENTFRALHHSPEHNKVLILGQDPYPSPGHAMGLSFSVDPHIWPLPRSLNNIFRERDNDLAIPPADNGDLTAWTQQGVLLLNRSLTTQLGKAGAHTRYGWDIVTDRILIHQYHVNPNLISILWGKHAQSITTALECINIEHCIMSAHPSPLSANKGFFGSRPFSRANALITSTGGTPIDWTTPNIKTQTTPRNTSRMKTTMGQQEQLPIDY